ncbi:metallo-beta-lactamase domain-containing protein 1 isoform X1 [Cherax quadricarinatus]|uniref:metallo-beta-lactamase domain-containing protein 1 isoform X1 n=1 Tax=Cherax quadricarinatus TaxID=27406 RepID=UPI002377E696|nr:metallo-beta-lactamase domain-containing protein 1-like isoform X1 [Cherax quadricarinatus]
MRPILLHNFKLCLCQEIMSYSVHVLHDGYSRMEDGMMKANCTCTLVKGPNNLIVDTMTAWDKEKIISGLQSYGITCDEINYAIGTHGHSDHLGNLNLFTNAKHVVGFTVSHRDNFFIHPFETGEAFKIDESVEVIPTPGHTSNDVSVVVKTQHLTTVIAGDLFEREEDITDPSLWKYVAGSENAELQEKHRNKVLLLADYIIPGHGPMFKVTKGMKEAAKASSITVK